MGELRSREDFALWHAWGRPMPHHQHPPLLLFDVLDSVRFVNSHDFRAYTERLRVAEQRSAWTLHLPESVCSTLEESPCTDGRTCRQCFREWGVEAGCRQHAVFTSLGPVVHLISFKQWHVLADIPRCTTRLMRTPKGVVLQMLFLIYF